MVMNFSKAHSPTQAPTMPFGKHKGTLLEELPSEYLLWLGCLDTLRQPLLGHVLREMARRIMELENQPERTGLAREGVQYASR
jgi:uncharacterized protein (DUF3820 family)